MNKKNLITLLSVLVMTLCVSTRGMAQAEDSQVKMDDQGNKMLVGRISEKQLANDSSFLWFFTGVNRYHPDTAWTKYISAYRDSFDVVVFAGTWCPESKKLLPAFYRVMLSSSYPAARIQLYGVDHQLHTLGDEAQQYKVVKTPTFIILRHGKEVGRIEEKVERSMEADMVMILDHMLAAEGGGKAAKERSTPDQ